MATVHDCDRCHAQVADTDKDKESFVVLTLAKLGLGALPFRRLELCASCADGVRHFLASPLTKGDK